MASILGAAGLGLGQGIGAGLAAVGQNMMAKDAASEAADALALKEYNLRMLMEDRQDTRDENKSDNKLVNKKLEQDYAKKLSDEDFDPRASVGGQYGSKGRLNAQGIINST